MLSIKIYKNGEIVVDKNESREKYEWCMKHKEEGEKFYTEIFSYDKETGRTYKRVLIDGDIGENLRKFVEDECRLVDEEIKYMEGRREKITSLLNTLT